MLNAQDHAAPNDGPHAFCGVGIAAYSLVSHVCHALSDVLDS